MRKVLVWGILLLFTLGSVSGCGSQDGTSTTATTTTTTTTSSGSTPSNVALTTSLTAGTELSQGGQTTITATVTDADSNLIGDGTIVTFTSSAGAITGTIPTSSGTATATFQAGTAGGVVTITATAGSVSGTVSITVASGAASSITLKSISPSLLGLAGTGIDEVGIVTFTVTDGGGNPVSDGQVVNFTLDSSTGGGEALSAFTATTTGGDVTVALQSGTVPGVATITASAVVGLITISTEARVSMGSGKPDALHFGLSREKLNIAGRVEFGLENKLTAFVADRFSNPVPANTPVFFASECGIVSLTDSGGSPTNFTSAFGAATATSITAAPTPADGRCTVIAWTEGEEAFVDLNGNGIFDGSDTHTDIPEPYIDANENGTFDLATETYFDLDGNGVFTAAVSSPSWDADTFIWTERVITWSGPTASPIFAPATFSIADGGDQEFIITVTDDAGNPLPAGSTGSVSATGGTLSGETSFTVQDALAGGSGITTFKVRLADSAAGDSDPADSVQITVDVTSTPNGDRTATISGTID